MNTTTTPPHTEPTLHIASAQTYLAVSVESLSEVGPVAELLSNRLNCVLFYQDEKGDYIQWKPEPNSAKLRATLKTILNTTQCSPTRFRAWSVLEETK